MDESALIKKHVRSINFLKTIPQGRETSMGTSQEITDGDSNNSFSVSCQSNNAASDRIDSIKSCESVLKIFTFETHNFNKNNEKCLAFWNALNERSDISPVDCTIMDANNNKKDSECQTEQKECEASLWARALYELRKRKLDVVALATNTDTCKFCKTINCFHMSAGFAPEDIEDKEDLTELDNWSPRTKNKSTQFTFQDQSIDVATSVSSELHTLGKLLSNEQIYSSPNMIIQPESNEKEDKPSFNSLEGAEQKTSSQKLVISNIRSIGFVPKSKNSSLRTTDDACAKESQPQQIKADDESLHHIAECFKSDENVSTAQISPEKLYETRSREPHEISESFAKKRVSIADVIRVSSTFPEGVSRDSLTNKAASKPCTKASSICTDTSTDLKKESVSGPTMLKCSDGIHTGYGSPFKQISFSTTGSDPDKRKKSQSIVSNVPKIPSKEIQKRSVVKLSSTRNSKSDMLLENTSSNEVSPEKPKYSSQPNIIDPSIVKYTKSISHESIKIAKSDPKLLPPILLNSMKKTSNAELPEEEKMQMSDTQKKSKVEFESTTSEKGTDTQHLSSLLYIETVKRLKIIADRKERLEEELRSNLSTESQLQVDSGESSDPGIYLCSCLETLKKSTCDSCSCKGGICKKPKLSDIQKIEQMFDHMPTEEKGKMKCFVKVIYQIKEIMEQNLDTETMDAKIIDVLSEIGSCKCEGEPCECKIHHLDVRTVEKNKNFMAATLLDKLNDVLDERYEAKLGETITKKSLFKTVSVNTGKPSAVNIGFPETRPCNICKMQNCSCILK